MLEIGIFTLEVTACVQTVELLAQVGTLGIFHKCHVGRLCQREQEFTLPALFLSHLRCFIHNAFWQPGKVVGSQPYFICVQIFQHVLAELGGEFRQLGTQLLVRFPVIAFEVRSRKGKRIIGALKQHRILRVKIQAGTVIINSLHPFPQIIVKGNGGAVVAQFRGDTHRNFHHLVVGVSRKNREENVERPVKVGAHTFQGHNGVFERWCRRICGNSVYLFKRQVDSAVDGGFIMRVFNLAERRRAMHGVEITRQRVLCLCHKRGSDCQSG